MKRLLVSTIAVLVILAAAWTVFGQEEAGRRRPREGEDWRMFQMLSPEETAKMREKWQSMSEEEREKFRAQMREKWQNLSEEEKEKLRAQMRERFGGRRRGFGSEEQLKAIKAIEEQLGKLKAGIEAMDSNDQRPFRDLPEEERTKLREKFSKAREERQTVLQTIIGQIAMLQGQRLPAEGEELVIVSTRELKAIQELAVKEKAEETARRIEMLSSGKRSFIGGPMGPRPTISDIPEGLRRPRGLGAPGGPNTPGGQEEKKAEVEK